MKFKFYAIKLSVILIFVFLLQLIIAGFTELFVLNQDSWREPWRFLTAIFLHASLIHLAYNLFALVLFGSILEKLIGGKKFIFVFFSTGILANLFSVNFYDASLGASGAIFGVIGALVIVRPLLVVWAFGLPMPIFVAGILWVLGDILGVFGFGEQGVGNIAHLSGMIFGMVLGYFFRSKTQKIRRRNVSIDENEIRLWEEKYLKG